jgi:hypothetical protein
VPRIIENRECPRKTPQPSRKGLSLQGQRWHLEKPGFFTVGRFNPRLKTVHKKRWDLQARSDFVQYYARTSRFNVWFPTKAHLLATLGDTSSQLPVLTALLWASV